MTLATQGKLRAEWAAAGEFQGEPISLRRKKKTMSYCRNCGTKLSMGSRFCTSCGTKVTDAQLEELTGEKAVVPDTIFPLKEKNEREDESEKAETEIEEVQADRDCTEVLNEERMITEEEKPENIEEQPESRGEFKSEDAPEMDGMREEIKNYEDMPEVEEDDEDADNADAEEDDEVDDDEDDEEDEDEDDEDDDEDDEEDDRRYDRRSLIEKRAKRDKKKKNVLKAIIAVAVVIVVLGIAAVILHFKSNKTSLAADKTEETSVESTEQEEAASTEEPMEKVSTEAVESEDASALGIDSTAVADYANVLEPEKFIKYTDGDGIPQFEFSYPSNLYNSAEVISTDVTNDYGTNVKSIVFTGSDNSSLIVSVTARTDSLSLKEAYAYAKETENARLHDEEAIFGSIRESNSKYIASGYVDENHTMMEYDLVKITSEYVYHLQLQYPSCTDDKDTKEKGYYVESIYRLCGFSDSSKGCRTYDDYVAGKN